MDEEAMLLENAHETRERQVRDLEALARRDPLTDLLNRRSFLEQAGKMREGERRKKDLASPRFMIIMCDIDHFKKINDTLGHDAGDAVIRNVAKMLRANVRPEDIVGRWGGEEFIIALRDGDVSQGMKIAEGLREEIEKAVITSGDTTIPVTMSFGVEVAHSEEPLIDIINRADKALYQAKHSGRNRVEVLAA